VSGAPSLLIAGTDDAGETFEPFEDGAERSLIGGAQGGMHVWMQLRLSGMCTSGLDVDRRIETDDEAGELVDVQRGPLRFTDGPEPGTFELAAPLTMILCPTTRPVIDQPFRFAVRAEDAEGRVVIERKPFVAACPTGACDLGVPGLSERRRRRPRRGDGSCRRRPGSGRARAPAAGR